MKDYKNGLHRRHLGRPEKKESLAGKKRKTGGVSLRAMTKSNDGNLRGVGAKVEGMGLRSKNCTATSSRKKRVEKLFQERRAKGSKGALYTGAEMKERGSNTPEVVPCREKRESIRVEK